jgi:hypothetical protein
VELTANVTQYPDSTYPVVITPAKIDLFQYTDSLVDEASVEIRNVSNQTLSISLVAGLPNRLEVTLPDSLPAGTTAQALVKLKPSARTEEFFKSITLEVSDSSATHFTIPVSRLYRAKK